MKFLPFSYPLRFFCVGIRILGRLGGCHPLARVLSQVSVRVGLGWAGLGLGLSFEIFVLILEVFAV